MATASGTVLFQRGLNAESDSDLWDDTALIKAYDNAINVMKAKVNGTPAVANDNESQASIKQDSKKRKRKRKKKHKNNEKSKKCPWKIGDQCRAVYTEDDLTYDAEIVDIDESAEICIIRYRGYGNEEEKEFSELLQPTRKQKHRAKSDLESDSMDWSARQSPAPDRRKKSTSSKSSSFPSGMPFMPPFPGPSMPFPFPSSHPGFMGPPTGGFPFIPPPPPPLEEDFITNDNEALCSMLMSWYMSGYHTGYYQGLKQSKRHRQTSTEPDSAR